MNIAIVGCGDIGVRTARLLLDEGHSVTGIRRNVAQLPDWLDSISADVNDRRTLDFLSTRSFDIVLYILAASGFNESAYQSAYVNGVTNTLDALGSQLHSLKRLVFVSSTSVYHQNDGSLVDENSPTEPVSFNGQLVLEGERTVTAHTNATVVRFSGIYGPGRTRMIERVRNNIFSDPGDGGYINRIHVEDCAGVLVHVMGLAEQGAAESHYLASDSAPCTRVELESFLADELGITAKQRADVNQHQRADNSKRIAGSKRCSNARLLQSGYRFMHPDFRSGYRQVLASARTKTSV